jgi:hypothetical protein
MLWHIKVLHQVWTSVAPICKLLGSRILSIPIMESFCEHTSESTLPTWVLYYIELFIPWRKKQLPHVKHEMRFLMAILTALLCYLSTLKSVSNLKQRLSHILLVKPKLWYNVWMPHFLKRICGLWLFAHFLLQIPKYSVMKSSDDLNNSFIDVSIQSYWHCCFIVHISSKYLTWWAIHEHSSWIY